MKECCGPWGLSLGIKEIRILLILQISKLNVA